MRASSKSCLLITAAVATSLGAAIGESKTEHKIYKGKDGSRVVIANKPKEEATPESVVEFYSRNNQKMCALDFSSEDREHGFGVVMAAWTPDESYFVFSLTSSGGHQAWHAPTLFYSLRDKEIHSLDSYSAIGISKSEFALKSPNTVLTEVWRAERQESAPIEFRLDSLVSKESKSRPSVPCADGKVFRVDPTDLQTHD